MHFVSDQHVHREQTGDTVIYSKYAGTEVALEGADYVLLKVVSTSQGCNVDATPH